MFATIRRHQSWLWVIVAGLTIISFVIFGPTNVRVGNAIGQAGSSNYGKINGHPITRDEFRAAQAEAMLSYFLQTGKWPDKDPNIAQTGFSLTKETYFRVMWHEKQKEMNIQVSADAVADRARQILGAQITADSLEATVLRPEGLTLDDFENYVRHELGVQQLIAVAGVAGRLVTPQEAEELYRKEHQDLSTVAAFFSASNHLAGITAAPEALADYYKAHLDNYFISKRVQVDYVKYDVGSFLPAVLARITNLDALVDSRYQQLGTNTHLFGSTPAEAKANLRTNLLQATALHDARVAAGELAQKLDTNAAPKGLALFQQLAQSNGLAVLTTTPFTEDDGPTNLDVPFDFIRKAFRLTTNEPFSGAIAGTNDVYVLALKSILPGEHLTLTNVLDRVAVDYKLSVALQAAQKAGAAFADSVSNSVPDAKTFTTAAQTAGGKAETLSPFSLSTQVAPDGIKGRTSMDLLKQVAFSLPVGKASSFVRTEEGGFVLYVAAHAPVDEAKLKKDLPDFVAYLRQTHENESLNAWFNRQIQKDPDFLQAINQAMENSPEFRSARGATKPKP